MILYLIIRFAVINLRSVKNPFTMPNQLYLLVWHILFICLITFYPSISQAITLEDSINSAIQNSTEIDLESKKAELTGLSKYDAASAFMPNANLSFRDGTRKTSINNDPAIKKDDKSRTLSINQPIFDGFSSVAKVAQSNYQTKSANHNLKFRKNEIALQVSESYLNILKYKKITEIEEKLKEDYKKLVSFASQKLSLKDISYIEFADYELKARRSEIAANQDKIALREYELSFTKLTKEKPEAFEYPGIANLNHSLDDFTSMARDENPKVKSLSFAYQARKAGVAVESGKLLPKVTMSFSYDHQKSSYYVNNQSLDNKSAYLNISVPLFQGGAEYNSIAKANKERHIANLERKLALEEIENQVEAEHQKYYSLKENLASLETAFISAQKSLDLAGERFTKKDIGIIDYLLKKIEVAEIEKEVIATKCEYILSYYKLKSLINEIIN